MTNGGYPDEETAMSVDDDDVEETDSNGSEEPDESEPQDNTQSHNYGANSQQLTDERRSAVESDGSGSDGRSEESDPDSVGLLQGGLTKHELIAFVGCFAASYALAAIFYWGIITSGGISDVPLQMWVLMGVVVLSPLALMFGLKETSTIADTLLNRGSR